MPLTLPPAVNFPSPLRSLPSLSQDEPREGRQQVPIEILWGTMGGTSKCIIFNLTNQGTLNISQISALKIDNSSCGADVSFIFPDTLETIDIPAGTPLAVVPVLSNSRTFYVSSPNAISTDETRFQVLNYAIDPASVDTSPAKNIASSQGILWDGPAPKTISTQLIAAGINGTLDQMLVYKSGNDPTFAGNNYASVTIKDGNGNFLISDWRYAQTNNTVSLNNIPLFTASDLNWRFQNGLIAEFRALSGWATGSQYGNYFATYSQP